MMTAAQSARAEYFQLTPIDGMLSYGQSEPGGKETYDKLVDTKIDTKWGGWFDASLSDEAASLHGLDLLIGHLDEAGTRRLIASLLSGHVRNGLGSEGKIGLDRDTRDTNANTVRSVYAFVHVNPPLSKMLTTRFKRAPLEAAPKGAKPM